MRIVWRHGVSPDTQEVEDDGGFGQTWRMTLSPSKGPPRYFTV